MGTSTGTAQRGGGFRAASEPAASPGLPSKKDTAVRRKELLDAVSPALLDFLCNNAHTMVTDKATSVTVSDILASACGDLRPAMTAVAQLANHELVPGGTNDQVGSCVRRWATVGEPRR